jgi:hypothetical protein
MKVSELRHCYVETTKAYLDSSESEQMRRDMSMIMTEHLRVRRGANARIKELVAQLREAEAARDAALMDLAKERNRRHIVIIRRRE